MPESSPISTEPIFGEAKEVTVRAKGPTLWTVALRYVSGAVKVRIEVAPEQSWKIGNDSCGAGGLFTGAFDALVPSAPNGALVAKLGGGDADCPPFLAASAAPAAPAAGATRMFAVGSYCVFEVKATEAGPLFLTMNDRVASFVNHSGELKVKVAIAVG